MEVQILSWRKLVKYCTAGSCILFGYNGWICFEAYLDALPLERIVAFVSVALSIISLVLSLAAYGENCNAKRVVRMYSALILSFGCSLILFAVSARYLAGPSDRWMFENYARYYLAVFAFAIASSIYYFQYQLQEKNGFLKMKRQLELNRGVFLGERPRETSSYTKIYSIGILIAAIATLKFGRTLGALYIAFLFSLAIGPFLVTVWFRSTIEYWCSQR